MALYAYTFHGAAADGTLLINSLHYKTVPPPLGSEPDMADVLTGLDGHLLTAYRACLSSNYEVLSTSLRSIPADLSSGVPEVRSSTHNLFGTLTHSNDQLPMGLSGIMSLQSKAASRSGRGYIVIPNPRDPTYLSTSQKWQGTFKTNCDAFALLLDDEIDMGSLEVTQVYPQIYSRTRHSRAQTPYSFDVTGAVFKTTPAWRRSRMNVP